LRERAADGRESPTTPSLFERFFVPALITVMVAVEAMWISLLVYLMALVV
jgi:hypothetical protein